MIKLKPALLGIVIAVFLVGIVAGGSMQQSTAAKDMKVPGWVKNNAGWWASGQIDDNSFVQGIQFMIKNKLMNIPPTSQGSGSGTNEIPSWIKNNAGWWASGQIDDGSFIQGIQYLIKEGIIRV